MRLTQLSGTAKRKPVRGSRNWTERPGSRTRSGSGGASGLVPQPARARIRTRELRRRARMRPKIDVLEMVRRKVRVELGRRHVGVPEHLLDRAQIAATRE